MHKSHFFLDSTLSYNDSFTLVQNETCCNFLCIGQLRQVQHEENSYISMRIAHRWRDAATRQLSIIHKWPTTGNWVGRAKYIFLHSHTSARHSLQNKRKKNEKAWKGEAACMDQRGNKRTPFHKSFIKHSPLLNSMSKTDYINWTHLQEVLKVNFN